MATDQYSVRLVGKAGKESEGIFILNEDEGTDQCCLTFQCPDAEIAVVANDYFEAMCHIRKELETRGWRPVCYGSARNV